jgi:hypothetical protein
MRFEARSGRFRSTKLKLVQDLSSRSIRVRGGLVELRGRVRRSLLGRRNPVIVRQLLCGRYRRVGAARPDRRGRYVVRFAAPARAPEALYRAESLVLVRRRGHRYVRRYARALGTGGL